MRVGLPHRRPGRGGLWLLLAGAAGILAAVLALRAATAPAPDGWALVARTALPAGTTIDDGRAEADLVLVAVPSDLPLSGVLDDPARAVGRRLAAHLGPGEPLTEAALGGAPGLGPAPLAPGERAVAAPIAAAGGASVALAPGVRVDVVASSGEGLTGRTAVVVADAEVLVVSPAGPTGEGGEVLLRVSAEQALRVTAAFNFAREVRLLIRPSEEAPGHAGPREVGAP
ncbi:MAG: SAF domain-containing protein [Miltoncostaeaceae bacterium]